MELNHHEIVLLLSEARARHLHADVLVSLLLDLFMEVEALREALIKIDRSVLEQNRGEHFQLEHEGSVFSVGKSTYQKAYLTAAFETHNNGGPSGGIDKLLARFYPTSADDLGRTWRECLLLRRLGFSAEEIDDYKNAAQDAEMLN
jgi:hypothetical protein